jgi:hypothetical protein
MDQLSESDVITSSESMSIQGIVKKKFTNSLTNFEPV